MSASGRKLDFARVLRDTIGILRRHAAALLGLTIVLYALPEMAVEVVALQLGLQPTGGGGAPDDLAPLDSPLYWGLTTLALIPTSLAMASQSLIALDDFDGRRASIGVVLQRGLARTLPVLAMTVICWIGVAIGLLLLVIPGLVLIAMWTVCIPALMERPGVFASLRRSQELTRGHRWRLLGLFAVAILALLAPYVVLSDAFASPTMLSALAASAYTSMAILPITIATAAIYVQLCELKGGGESVAQVFS